MANITKRTGKNGRISYRIRVYVGESKDGEQKFKSHTWTPDPKMTPKQVEKELTRQATLFEEKIHQGLISLDGKTRFADYADKWLKNVELAPSTRTRYTSLLVRINDAIGHIKLENLQAHHLEAFYQNLKETGVKEKGRWAIATSLGDVIKARRLSLDKVANMAAIAPATVGTARRGKQISIEKATQIAEALGLDVSHLFQVCDKTTGLSEKTIRHHHALISTILAKAKRERIIPFNVAGEHATAPRVHKKEAAYLDDYEARNLFNLLIDEEDIRVKTALLLALYSGVRRGELCGLSWGDVDNKTQVIKIRRASQYQSGKGVVEVSTKNEHSERDVKLPAFIFELLTSYKSWWTEQRFRNGTKWQGQDNRLFIQANGKPINPDTINFWLQRFREKHNLRHFTPHSLRHTFATLQIAAGVDLRTLQARTGHAQASTLVNIYSHAIKSANEAATEALDNMLNPVARKARIV